MQNKKKKDNMKNCINPHEVKVENENKNKKINIIK